MQVFVGVARSRKSLVCVGLLFVVGVVVVVRIFDMHMTTLASLCDTDSIKKLITEKQKQHPMLVQQTKTMKVQKDVFDNNPAKAYITAHSQRFQPKDFNLAVAPDPNKQETITTWWQGLAMLDWYMRAPVRYTCKNRRSMGNWFICQDEPYTVKPPCLVYSFGINWEFAFDDAMTKLGCEVHMFDPSMKEKDHMRTVGASKSWFHNMGIGSYNTDSFIPTKDIYVKDRQTWKIRTVKAIMKELGHENRVIDVFKMDVETYEWTIIDNMLETGVFKYIRQFELEYHVFPTYPILEEYVHLFRVYTGLREAGIREYYAHQHVRNIYRKDKIRLQADMCYVNAFFDRNNLGS